MSSGRRPGQAEPACAYARQVVLKRLTFVRRAAGASADDFGSRWRDQARRLADVAPEGARPRRLVHGVVRPGRTDRPHHGVAIEWFDDEHALAAHDAHAAAAVEEPVVDTAATARVRVDDRFVFGGDQLEEWWRDEAGESRLLLVAVLQAKEGLGRPAFADYWWNVHRPLANRMLPPDLQPPIYVHDYALPGEASAWDGVGEFYDPSVEAVRRRTRWTESDDARELVADEARFLIRESRYVLITDAEVVLHDD